MVFGNMPRDGGALLLQVSDLDFYKSNDKIFLKYLRRFVGSEDLIHSKQRYCLWIEDEEISFAIASQEIQRRLESVKNMRLASNAESTRTFSRQPHRFVQIQGVAKKYSIIIPRHSSERRDYLPIGIADANTIVADSAFALYDAPLWCAAILLSKMHLSWVASVCGKLKNDYRYSNTIGWNTFPLPKLTDKNISDLTDSAFSIFSIRESFFPMTIADLYERGNIPSALIEAHDRNDEIVDRIFAGKIMRSPTERLKCLLAMYKGMKVKASNRTNRKAV